MALCKLFLKFNKIFVYLVSGQVYVCVCYVCVFVCAKYMCLEMLKTDGQSKTKTKTQKIKPQAEIVKGWEMSQFVITKGTAYVS